MIEPYYKDEMVTLYLGRCESILPQLEVRADLLLTDPPYGHGWHGIDSKSPGGRNWTRRRAETIEGADTPFDPTPFLDYPDVVLWGANHYANRLPASAGWFVWDKRFGTTSNNLSDCELAWNKNGGSVRVFRHLWNGLCRDSEVGVHLHPTQKPVKLMAWCMEFFPKTKLVLDPYAGSGTTLVAAKLLGRSSVGIEMNEKYCQMIVDRLNKPIPLFEQEEQLNAFAANSA